MAEPAQPCSCSPYVNLCCCGPDMGINVVQPKCQNLPDGSVVNNPAFVPQLGKSYWTYKFITDCAPSTMGISNFGILICGLIRSTHMTVSEKIDGCGQFEPVEFTLTKSDPNFGIAPEGFQYVKVEINDRFEKGVSVEYRLEIVGDFPVAIQPIKVKAGPDVITFDCHGCFLVPQCNPEGKLNVTKECGHIIHINNQATLVYSVDVDNIGDGTLDNVQFEDTLFISTLLTTGTITVTPDTLNVDTSLPGQIRISGNLGTIPPSGEVLINYNIPIIGIAAPGKFITNNVATVSATGTQAMAQCSTNLDVIELNTSKCCKITDTNKGVFQVTIASVGNSHEIFVDVFDHLTVPGGLTVQFNDFGGCTAFFSNSGDTVPINTNLSGPLEIDISCDSLLIPALGMAQKNISFTVVSSSVFGIATMTNSVLAVEPTFPDAQVFLGAGVLPVTAAIDVELGLQCKNPCS